MYIMDKDVLIKIFTQSVFNREFEFLAAEYNKTGVVRNPIYLSVGTEHISPTIKETFKELNIIKYNIFAQHRCHSIYLTFADKPEKLIYELCGSSLGCNGGYGGSASLSHTKNTNIKMWGHSGLLGDQIPIAVGAAHASNIPVICICGDAAVEEDYALGAFGYAITKKAPILFICEDNGLSVLTETKTRRSWNIFDVTQSMGIQSVDIDDKPQTIASYIKNGINNLPYFINIRCQRHMWHAGHGVDNPPKWNTLSIIAQEIGDISKIITQEQKNIVKNIWKQSLTQLGK